MLKIPFDVVTTPHTTALIVTPTSQEGSLQLHGLVVQDVEASPDALGSSCILTRAKNVRFTTDCTALPTAAYRAADLEPDARVAAWSRCSRPPEMGESARLLVKTIPLRGTIQHAWQTPLALSPGESACLFLLAGTGTHRVSGFLTVSLVGAPIPDGDRRSQGASART